MNGFKGTYGAWRADKAVMDLDPHVIRNEQGFHVAEIDDWDDAVACAAVPHMIKALKPFAQAAKSMSYVNDDEYIRVHMTVGDLRAALAAYLKELGDGD